MKITIKYVPNILHKEGRQTKFFLPAGERRSLRTWLNRSGFNYKGNRVILNGKRILPGRFSKVILKAGDEVIVTPEIRDPVTIGTIFATIGTALGASATVAAALHTIGMLVGIIGIVGSIGYSIYSALQKPKTPSFSGIGEGLDESQTYSWDGAHTTTGEGVGRPIPVIYGRHAYGGQIINRFISTDGDKNYLNLLLCAGQGEINAISDIKINGNPIDNFDGVEVTTRMGTSNQAVIPHFEDLHNLYNVNVQLLKDNSHTYTTINDDVEAFEIGFNFPSGLYSQSGAGGIEPWSVSFRVEYKLTTSGVWTDLGITTISHKARSAFPRIFRKDGLTAGRYDIRVTRTSADSSLSPLLNGDLIMAYVDEIKTDDLIYPNLALIGIKLLATNQLSGSIPNITFIEEGRKCRIPDIRNGGNPVDWEDYYWDPDEEVYKLLSDDTSLTWDGETYVESWTANPVWCIREAIINERYGLGDIIDQNSIPDSEYLDMSRVCERKVPDGEGGFEKLYRLDVVLDSLSKALDIISQLSAVFDAFVFYSQDTVRIKIDQDEDPVQIFGMGNTYPKSLNMVWKSRKDLHNIIDVQFADKDKDYALDTVSIVHDAGLAAGEPLRRKSLRVHTTKISYAIRAGRRALNVSRNINRIFSFKAGIDAIACSPGDIIGFSHDTPAIGLSGRIKSGSTDTSIKLDQEVTIENGKTYKLIIQFDDDTLEERTVTNAPGATDTITVSDAFSAAPAAFDRYAFGEQNIYYKKLRVVSLQIDSDLDVNILASEVNPAVYDYSAVVIPTTNFSMLSLEIPDVTNLALTEMVIKAGDGTIINTIEVWFTKPTVSSFQLNQYKKAIIFLSADNGASWVEAGETTAEHIVLTEGIETGQTYKIAVVSVANNGMENAIADSPQSTITILGKAAAPSTVTGFDVQQQGDQLRFRWTAIPDGDLARYVIKEGGDWPTGQTIAEKVDVTEFTYPIGTIGEKTYMIKAIDTSENESAAPAFDTITITPPPEMNFVVQVDPWAQNREYKLANIDRIPLNLYNRRYNRDVFVLKTTDIWPEVEGQDWQGLDIGAKGFETSGSIEQIVPIDLQVIFEFNLIVDMDLKNVAGGSITVQISHSEDGVAWSAFANVDPTVNYRARYVKFKYLVTGNGTDQVFFYAGTIFINAPNPKTDFGRDVLIDAGGTAITFRDDFTATPRITALAIKNGVLGIIEVTSITQAGMTLKVYNPVTEAYVGTAEVDWEVRGS